MSDETNNKIALVNLPEVPDSIDRAVSNITECPTQNIGQTLGDIWYLVFGGITHAANKKRLKYSADLEKYQAELNEAINNIPADKQIEPSIQVTAQALENSKYCVSSESLRNMFVKLITGTMNKDLEPLVHPSFPEMIKQMDENDAHILMELKRKSHDIPIAEFQELFTKNNSNITHYTNVYLSDIFNISLLDCSCSLSSLERMGLISITYDSHLIDDSLYESFYETSLYQKLAVEITNYNRNSKISLKKGICSITPLGKRFMLICVS